MCFWDGHAWIICVAADEPPTRQRFTVMHELKHIIDHGHDHQLYRGHSGGSPAQQAELAADHFAGCVLMPRRLVRRAWRAGHRQPAALAHLFDVSRRAVDVRLAQLNLAAECSAAPVPRQQSRRIGDSPVLGLASEGDVS